MNEIDKERVLVRNGWTLEEGWIMDYEKDSEHTNVLITKKDFERFKKENPKKYFWFPDDEYVRDLEDAWECFLDNYAESNDLDMSMEEIEAYVEKNEVRV